VKGKNFTVTDIRDVMEEKADLEEERKGLDQNMNFILNAKREIEQKF